MAVTPYCTAQDVIDCCDWPRFGVLSAASQTRLINAASTRIDGVCRRPFGFSQQSVSETLDGRNSPRLYLSLLPVIQVMSVAINGDALDNTYGTAWAFDGDTGKLIRGNGQDADRFQPWFPAGTQNVVVQYWGGYSPLPDQLVLATAQYVRYLYEQGKVPGVYQSESLGDWSGTLNSAVLAGTVPAHVMALLAEYIVDDAI